MPEGPHQQQDEAFLIVDDDPAFCQILGRSLQRRHFSVRLAYSVTEGRQEALTAPPANALVDLCLPDGSGLDLVRELAALESEMQIVVLTGYASIPTAVDAVKLGATQYLAKPADTSQVLAAFGLPDPSLGASEDPSSEETPMSIRRLEWEHLQRVLAECHHNVSEAARRLGMHRRTLQRKLQKRPPLK